MQEIVKKAVFFAKNAIFLPKLFGISRKSCNFAVVFQMWKQSFERLYAK